MPDTLPRSKRPTMAPDILGERFGQLTVIARAGSSPRRAALWECRCTCGNSTTASAAALRRGKKVSCGCKRINDLTGQTFVWWTVLHRSEVATPYNRGSMWQCRCRCGVERAVKSSNLTGGLSTSCGCRRTTLLAQITQGASRG